MVAFQFGFSLFIDTIRVVNTKHVVSHPRYRREWKCEFHRIYNWAPVRVITMRYRCVMLSDFDAVFAIKSRILDFVSIVGTFG